MVSLIRLRAFKSSTLPWFGVQNGRCKSSMDTMAQDLTLIPCQTA